MSVTIATFSQRLATLIGNYHNSDGGQAAKTTLQNGLDFLFADAGLLLMPELAQQIQDHVDLTETWVQQYRAWTAGTATGGPKGDGQYPIVDRNGANVMLPSPAKLMESLTGFIPSGTVANRAALNALTASSPVGTLHVADDTGIAWVRKGSGWVSMGSWRGPSGASAYASWQSQAGNAGKTEAQFVDWIITGQNANLAPMLADARAARDASVQARDASVSAKNDAVSAKNTAVSAKDTAVARAGEAAADRATVQRLRDETLAFRDQAAESAGGDFQPRNPILTGMASQTWSSGKMLFALTAEGTITSLKVGAAASTDIIDRSTGDVRYARNNAANTISGATTFTGGLTSKDLNLNAPEGSSSYVYFQRAGATVWRFGFGSDRNMVLTHTDENGVASNALVLRHLNKTASFRYEMNFEAGLKSGGSTVWTENTFNPNDYFRKSDIPLFAGGANGSEGGEIRLAKSAGSSWAGNMVMDVQGNHIRFWEEGGNYRGFYLNITKGRPGHSEIVHSDNLNELKIPRTDVNNDFTGEQIMRGPSGSTILRLVGGGNASNGTYGVGPEFVLSSFEPRFVWQDRSTNAKNMLMGYAGNATGGTFYLRNDVNGDDTYSDVALTLNTSTKVLQIGGKDALTVDTGVQRGTTNLGQTSNGPLISGTRNASWWSGLPTGYNAMTNLTTDSGSPLSGYGYFFKTARRDADNGWCGLWQGYNAQELYFGGAASGSNLPGWHRIWSSANFNPIGKLDCAVDGWRNDASGHPRFWFGSEGASQGRSFYRGYGHEFRSRSDAHLFSVSDTGVLTMAGDQWHRGGGDNVFYFRTSDKVTFIRGGEVHFRNTANNTIGQFDQYGRFFASGDIYGGDGAWIRVRGAAHGFYWENWGGGWQMTDANWVRSFNNKGILTTGTISMGAFTITSDRRIKRDFAPIEHAGEIIDATDVYEFTKNPGTPNEQRQYGVIAQEALEVVPLLVKPSGAKHEDGSDLLGVDLLGYIPILLEEVKTLRARVAELEAR